MWIDLKLSELRMLADRKSANRDDYQDGNAASQRDIGDSHAWILEVTDPGPPCAIRK